VDKAAAAWRGQFSRCGCVGGGGDDDDDDDDDDVDDDDDDDDADNVDNYVFSASNILQS